MTLMKMYVVDNDMQIISNQDIKRPDEIELCTGEQLHSWRCNANSIGVAAGNTQVLKYQTVCIVLQLTGVH